MRSIRGPSFDVQIISDAHNIILQNSSASEIDQYKRISWQLSRLINFSTHLIYDFSQCQLSVADTVAAGVFRAIAVRADGIRQLLLTGSGEQCGIMLRPMLESVLGLLYMIADEKQFETRTLAYRYCNLKQEESELAFLIADSATEPEAIAKSRARIVEIQQVLADPEFALTKISFDTAKANRRPTNWYSLNSGPNNVKDLAKELGHSQWYYMYKKFSQRTHAADGLDGIVLVRPDLPVTTPLRYPAELPIINTMACAVLLRAIHAFVEQVFPAYNNRFLHWFELQIRKNSFASPLIEIEWVLPNGTPVDITSRMSHDGRSIT